MQNDQTISSSLSNQKNWQTFFRLKSRVYVMLCQANVLDDSTDNNLTILKFFSPEVLPPKYPPLFYHYKFKYIVMFRLVLLIVTWICLSCYRSLYAGLLIPWRLKSPILYLRLLEMFNWACWIDFSSSFSWKVCSIFWKLAWFHNHRLWTL